MSTIDISQVNIHIYKSILILIYFYFFFLFFITLFLKKTTMKHPITEILGQKWFDRLSEYYDIGDFPPLHSLTFGEWCLIMNEEESEERPLTAKTFSLNNDDIWTMIEDNHHHHQPLYSDIVRSIHITSPSSSSRHLFQYNNKKKKMINEKKGTDDNDQVNTYDDVWFLSKSSSSYRQKQKKILNQTFNRRHRLPSPLVTDQFLDQRLNKMKKMEKKPQYKNDNHHHNHFVQHRRKHR
ncbi:hypothetical protein BJ944DRAFT_266784 [Cunninghamella echinulata]|nr:hypothetical protein BJ944DRAFT_266784 [Cunninghamella echinulata]